MTAYIHAIFMPADRSLYTADIIAAFQNNNLKVPRLPQKLIGGSQPRRTSANNNYFFQCRPHLFYTNTAYCVYYTRLEYFCLRQSTKTQA